MQLIVSKGGPESGFHGHAGRPGLVGGSAAGSGNYAPGSAPKSMLDASKPAKAMIEERRATDILREKGFQMLYEPDPRWRKGIDKIPEDSMSDHYVRREIKEAICLDIAKRADVDPEDVNNVLEAWSGSCKSMQSLSFQEAMSEELGVPLSDYQKTKLKGFHAIVDKWEAEQEWKAEATKFGEELRAEKGDQGLKLNDYNDAWKKAHPDAPDFTEIIVSSDKGPYKSDNPYDDISYVPRAKERKIARAMYESTQELLKNAPNTITLHRGIHSSKVLGDQTSGYYDLQKGTTAKYTGNSIESWSSSWDSAAYFARGGATNGVILSITIPKKSIFCTSVTGLGCFSEQEYVILGTIPGNEVFAKSVMGR
jgi:hypothetical protein